MAPIRNKRSRIAPHEDDADAVDEDSSTRKSGHKKSRLSGPQIRLSEHREDSESSDEAVDREPQHEGGPPLTQYEIDRDGDFEHLAHEAEDDALATQKFTQRKEFIGENIAAENGVIISVECVNFMCHTRMFVELGPLINFIIGENGSGKSAVLTAITLCLGGKASTTNRGGSLKSFIKSGQEHARLTIKLKNEGVDAYQPDTYGDVITVERNFSTSGSSGFKLKNERGAVISTKKGDVEEVIEYFQMQLDNPMNVLTQDDARRFINQSTPAQKYKFFVKGVQLEQLNNDYGLLQETTDAMEARLMSLALNVTTLRKEMEKAEEKARIVNEHEEMRQASHSLRNQSAWAQVEEEEASLLERHNRVTAAKANVEAKQRDAETKSASYEQVHQKHELCEAASRSLQEEMEPLAEEEVQAKSAFDVAAQEVQSSHQEQRQIKGYLTAAKNKLDTVNKEIKDEELRLENINGGAHARKVNELAEAQERIHQTTAKLEESSGEKPGLEDKLREAESARRAFLPIIERKQQEIKACEAKIESLKKDSGHAMAGYDPKIRTLMNMIRDDRGWQERPVGPVGLHISLRKPIWSNALEKSIGNILSGFVVTTKTDQQRLSGLIRRSGVQNCPVLIGNTTRIERLHEPDVSFDTILRVLDIDSELVKNQLIITQAIEQTLLIEDRKDADRVMYSGTRPSNVKACFTINNEKRGWGVRLGYMAGPNPGNEGSMGPIEPPRGAPRMKTDIESQITYQQDTLEHLHREYGQLESRKRELDQSIAKCQQAIKQQKVNHQKLTISFQRSEEAVERLQQDIDQDNVVDNCLEGLRDYLKECQEEVDLHSASYGDAGVNKERLNQVSSARKKDLDEVKMRIRDHEMKIRKAHDKHTRAAQARQLALQDKNFAFQAIEQASELQAAAEQKRDRQQVRVDDFIRQASQICARVQVDEGQTAASIDKKLHALKETLDTYNRRLGGTDQEINQRHERAIKKFKTAEKQYNELSEVRTLLKKSYMQRITMWRKFQRHISARARISFMFLLSERGFRGRLKFAHKDKLLDLSIEPDETVKSMKGRKTKTLSGGEKSFSSICLLLSLWEAMGAPLRCLDEFDVFMDQVNRDVSTRMIITAARRSVGRQYILITPNAIGGGAERDPDVKIIRFNDPRQKKITDQLTAVGGTTS